MNKADLIDALEAKLGSRQAANEAINVVVDTIVRAVSKGERVAISGFGTFEKVQRAARTGRNPRTGETVRIKKTAVPRFKPGGAFKTFVATPRALPKAGNGHLPVTARVSATGADGAAKKAAPAKKAAVRKTAASSPKATGTATAKAVAGGAASGTVRKTTMAKTAAPAARKSAVSRTTTRSKKKA